jgi:hypothetical protein
MERHFEIGLPVQIVHSHWEDFRREHEGARVRLELEPAGGDSTRVRLLAPDDADGEGLEDLARHFCRYLQARGEGHVPLAGTMVSPGAPNAGMNDMAGLDAFPPREPPARGR